MVKKATVVGYSGLHAWLIQRITAAILALYLIYLCIYVILTSGMDYDTWYFLQTSPSMKIINTLVLLSLIYHALIGIWTVITDYIKKTCIRLPILTITHLGLLACLIYGLYTIFRVT